MVLELLTISGKFCYDKFKTLWLLCSSSVMSKGNGGYMCSKRHFDLTLCRHQTFSKWPHQGLKVKRGAEPRLKNNSYMFLSWRDFDMSVLNRWLSFSHLIFCLSCVRLTFPVFSLLFKNACWAKCEDLTLSFLLNTALIYHFYFLMKRLTN